MYNVAEVEKQARERWRQINLLALLQKKNKKGKKFFLLDGPPYANDLPHIGHIRNTVYKDLFIRLAFMQGMDVLFQPGFDTHGLPVENKVEKKLGITSKKEIAQMGVDKFCAICKEHAATNKDLWMNVYDILGSWYSWKEPYLSYENSYIESGWWAFKQMYDKSLAYEGKKPVFWCPKCMTALAGYEVTDSYKMVRDPVIFIKFKVKKTENDFLFVFTTTPWTLLSNVAVAALPDGTYVKVETMKGNLILAKDCLKILQDIGVGFKIIQEYKGKDLEGLEYEPIIDLPVQQEIAKHPKSHKVIMSIPILKERIASKVAVKKDVGESGDVFEDFVSTADGTGLVHCAPGHGKTDNEIGKKYGLIETSPLDDECKYTEGTGEFLGRFVKECDQDIIKLLEQTDRLVHSDSAEHKYPLCWRCKSPLIFRMSNQWFLSVEKLRGKMLSENKNVRWQPDYANERFESWVANADDWCVSRQRYWGIPMPVWKCKECGHVKVIGSVDELRSNAIEEIKGDMDLHTVNLIHLKCPCSGLMDRINDIFDVWFDAGCAPWASLGYPKANKELFESHFPVSRVNESQDQIRGWFYSLMFCGVGVFGKRPFEYVSMPGWVVDEKGEKMSKSLGNVIFAKEGIEELGADLVRFYYMWDIAPYELEKFSKETVKKEVSKLFNVLWNLKSLVANNPTDAECSLDRVEDKWIMSRLNSTIAAFQDSLDTYEFQKAGRAFYSFILDDLSRSYIQFVRERMGEDPGTYAIVKKCLIESCKLLAIVSPFITDRIYTEICKDKESVHLEKYPKADKKLINAKLEEDVATAMEIVQGVLALREKMKRGVRWPLPGLVVVTEDSAAKKAVENMREVILSQTNIKELVFETELKGMKKKVRANFEKLNADFGSDAPKLIAKLATSNSETILTKLAKDNKFVAEIDGAHKELTSEHFIIERIVPDEFSEVQFNNGFAYVDRKVTDALDSEGYSREIMRKIQAFRKESGLVKEDKISLFVKVSPELQKMISGWQGKIKDKVNATQLNIAISDPSMQHEFKKADEIKQEKIELFLNKA